MDKQGWLRVRFTANPDDYRPIKWPPVGPYWCSGYNGKGAVVVAFVRTLDQVMEFWPEAEDIDPEEVAEITFTSRFAKPKWWEPVAAATTNERTP